MSPQGKFSKTVVAHYRENGIRYEEHQTVTGATDERAPGTIRARAIATRPTGRGALHLRTQTWSAIN